MEPKKTVVVEQQTGEARFVKTMFHGCPHAYQDEKYGPHQRVFNRTKGGWRCTVCGGHVT